MKCKECQKLGLKSKIYIKGQQTTLLGYISFYDEDGIFHEQNPNTITTHYECSNGHKWKETNK